MKDYCGIVQDLWPLYLEDELSEESRRFIAEHVAGCPKCLELSSTNLNFHELLAIPPVTPGSAEGFILKLRRRIRLTAVSLIISALAVIGGVWYFTGSQAGRVYRQEIEQEKRFFQEQLVALEEVSPPAELLLQRLGLKFVVRDDANSSNQIKISYALLWEKDSPVEWVTTDRHWFSEDILVDAASGEPLQLAGGGGSYAQRQFEGHIEASSGAQPVDKVVLKTRTVYAFAKPENEISVKFDYTGGKTAVELGQHFNWRGVEFVIDNLQLNDKEFVVNYRQLTPAAQAGVYVLNFAFDDRLGNHWNTDPDADLIAVNPKRFTMKAPHSPSKKWQVIVNHVVQVIPGIKANVQLEEEMNNEPAK